MAKTKRKKKLEAKKVEEITEKQKDFCKDCKRYDRVTARCSYHDIYVARKNSCDNFERKR